MYVIVDLEWFETMQGEQYPTQIAALRINENWIGEAAFDALICPKEGAAVPWWEISFAGYAIEDFLQAHPLYTVLEKLEKWLREDDVLCWWGEEASEVFERLTESTLGHGFPQAKRILQPYFMGYAQGGQKLKKNPYALSRSRNLWLPAPEHCSHNDVLVLRQLMSNLGFTTGILDGPVPTAAPESAPKPAAPQKMNFKTSIFLCDENTGMLHIHDSPCLDGITAIKGMETVKGCLESGYKPCSECCQEAWEQAVRKYNEGIVQQHKGCYFFFKEGKVFHTGECECILSATSHYNSAVYYSTCIKKGRVPCEICRPTPNEKKSEKEPESGRERMSETEKRAVMRYQQALKERSAARQENLSPKARRDMLTLTSADCIFWASAGYQNFHLRQCRKLRNLTNLRGFSTFQQATSAGYQPCRECRPTPKDDLKISMSMYTVERAGESIESIFKLCEKMGIAYTYTKPILTLNTSAAQWKIDVELRPVVIEHRPLDSPHFHKQHRMFLSLSDAVRYIGKHTKKEATPEGTLMTNLIKWKNQTRK